MEPSTVEMIVAGIMSLLIVAVMAVLLKAEALPVGALVLAVGLVGLVLGILAGVLLVVMRRER